MAKSGANTKREIISAAAPEFKTRGFDNLGVAELMSQVGLPHGGFYRHFKDKDELILEACEEAFNEMTGEWCETLPERSFIGLVNVLAHYLPYKIWDRPGDTCAIAMVGSDLARANMTSRAISTKGFKNFVDLIARFLPEGESNLDEAADVACSVQERL